MTPLIREYNILKSAGLSDEFIREHYAITTEIPLRVLLVFYILLSSVLIASIVTIAQGLESSNLFLWLVGMVVSTLFWHAIFSVNTTELLNHLGYGEYHIIRIPDDQPTSEERQ